MAKRIDKSRGPGAPRGNRNSAKPDADRADTVATIRVRNADLEIVGAWGGPQQMLRACIDMMRVRVIDCTRQDHAEGVYWVARYINSVGEFHDARGATESLARAAAIAAMLLKAREE